jgi:hypothetical protein
MTVSAMRGVGSSAVSNPSAGGLGSQQSRSMCRGSNRSEAVHRGKV